MARNAYRIQKMQGCPSTTYVFTQGIEKIQIKNKNKNKQKRKKKRKRQKEKNKKKEKPKKNQNLLNKVKEKP